MVSLDNNPLVHHRELLDSRLNSVVAMLRDCVSSKLTVKVLALLDCIRIAVVNVMRQIFDK